jgi:putative membrane protein
MANRQSKPKAVETAIQQSAQAVKQHSREVAETAQHLERSSARVESSADLTTRLAADRTLLAAERTYAAWVRTGLFALASGVGARALLTGLLPDWLVRADATALVLFSVFCFAAAIWRELQPGAPPPAPSVQQLPRALLITINGFLALVSLAALVGILAPR